MRDDPPRDRFHGRVRGVRHACAHPGCAQTGEFRAPGYGAPSSDGPAPYRWLCLDHVREFNAGYNYFSGMSADEIVEAQMPFAGWARETRAFTQGGVDSPPKWRDFHDPLDAIAARFASRVPKGRADGKPLSGDDRNALGVLMLGHDADRKALRTRYAELVRKYHPDRNGGDRSHERALTATIAAYQHLRKSPAFA